MNPENKQLSVAEELRQAKERLKNQTKQIIDEINIDIEQEKTKSNSRRSQNEIIQEKIEKFRQEINTDIEERFAKKLEEIEEIKQQASFIVKKLSLYRAMRGRIIAKEIKLLGNMCGVSFETLEQYDLPRGYGNHNLYYNDSKKTISK